MLTCHDVTFFQQPHKNQILQGYANKAEKKLHSLTVPKPLLSAEGTKIAASRRLCTQKIQKTPQVNSKCIMSLVLLTTGLVHIPLTLRSREAAWYSLC